MDDQEFLKMLTEACNGKHCPEDLVKMATTKWQKQVAVEFVLQDKKIDANRHDLKVLKKICWGILLAVSGSCVVQVIVNVLFGLV